MDQSFRARTKTAARYIKFATEKTKQAQPINVASTTLAHDALIVAKFVRCAARSRGEKPALQAAEAFFGAGSERGWREIMGELFIRR